MINSALYSNDLENEYYSKALNKEVLLKSSINKFSDHGILTQKLNGVKTVFLDFLEQEANDIWKKGLNDLLEIVGYDGIWLSNNEATGVCNGECPT